MSDKLQETLIKDAMSQWSQYRHAVASGPPANLTCVLAR